MTALHSQSQFDESRGKIFDWRLFRLRRVDRAGDFGAGTRYGGGDHRAHFAYAFPAARTLAKMRVDGRHGAPPGGDGALHLLVRETVAEADVHG